MHEPDGGGRDEGGRKVSVPRQARRAPTGVPSGGFAADLLVCAVRIAADIVAAASVEQSGLSGGGIACEAVQHVVAFQAVEVFGGVGAYYGVAKAGTGDVTEIADMLGVDGVRATTILSLSKPDPPQIRSFPPRPLIVSSPPSPTMTSGRAVPRIVSSPLVPILVATLPKQLGAAPCALLACSMIESPMTPVTAIA